MNKKEKKMIAEMLRELKRQVGLARDLADEYEKIPTQCAWFDGGSYILYSFYRDDIPCYIKQIEYEVYPEGSEENE